MAGYTSSAHIRYHLDTQYLGLMSTQDLISDLEQQIYGLPTKSLTLAALHN